MAEEESLQLMMGQDADGNPVDYVQMEDLHSDGKPKSAAIRRLEERPFSNRKHTGLYYIFGAAILVVLSIVGLSTLSGDSAKQGIGQLSNGTHLYNPTTVYISLDGFHPQYVSEKRSPHLARLVNFGFSTPYIVPSFPSQTFPNHWTLATGLYPVNHGIVGNSFFDPMLNRNFKHVSPTSLDRVFWGGEPLWATAKKHKRKSAVHMWPGSEVDFEHFNPDFVDKFNKTEVLSAKRDRILDWLDLPIKERPELIMAYVPTVDTIGHKFGISGDEVIDSITQVDTLIGEIVAGLEDRNLTEVVNLVVVSDHGMAPTSDDRLVFLDDLIDTSVVQKRTGWPLSGLWLDINDVEPTVERIRDKLGEGAHVYKSSEMPQDWHFDNQGKYGYRMPPVYIVPNVGWSILTHAEYADQGNKYKPHGVHGYDSQEVLMRGFFAASGPGFKPGHYEPFENVNVYSLVCRSMQMRPAVNDGEADLKPLQGHFINRYPDVEFAIDYITDSLFDNWPLPK